MIYELKFEKLVNYLYPYFFIILINDKWNKKFILLLFDFIDKIIVIFTIL